MVVLSDTPPGGRERTLRNAHLTRELGVKLHNYIYYIQSVYI